MNGTDDNAPIGWWEAVIGSHVLDITTDLRINDLMNF